MPRAAGTSLQNRFIRGLITESTGLNLPEDACTEIDNCILTQTGEVKRRLGINYEESHQTTSVIRSNSAISEFEWEGAGGTGSVTLVVVQVGNTLHFYETSDAGALSAQKKSFTVSLNTFLVSGAPDPGGSSCQFDFGNGLLFVTHPNLEPFFVEYDPVADTISTTQIDIKVRDTQGVEDSLRVDERPSTLSDLHKYNLFNQGWATTHNGFDVILTAWDNARSDFPSNKDVWYISKDTNEQFNTGWIDRIDTGNSPSPKGHYIMSAFDMDRDAVTAERGIAAETITGLPSEDSGIQRPTSVAFFGGRVFYTGVNAPGYNSKIYFSQQIIDNRDYGKCYQVNDPTSSENSDLLPTDGGDIQISEVDSIIRLVSTDQYLLVFATNGVWAISGSSGIGFLATDYSVRRLSTTGTQSKDSFVVVEGLPFFWSQDGIYRVLIEQVSGYPQLQSITDTTIKTFFDEIPASAKPFVKGSYNERDKVVQWLYRKSDVTTDDDNYNYEHVLCLDILSTAFYPWTLQGSQTINGIISVAGRVTNTVTENVTNNLGQTVVDNLSNPVTTEVDKVGVASNVFYYVTTDNTSGSNYDLSFARERDTGYLDWGSLDYTSTFTTGYQLHGGGNRKFQPTYLTVLSKGVKGSSLKLRGIWDYGCRETSDQQVYVRAFNKEYIDRRVKLRGHGVVLQLKFTSEQGKPFHCIGWIGYETANQMP